MVWVFLFIGSKRGRQRSPSMRSNVRKPSIKIVQIFPFRTPPLSNFDVSRSLSGTAQTVAHVCVRYDTKLHIHVFKYVSCVCGKWVYTVLCVCVLCIMSRYIDVHRYTCSVSAVGKQSHKKRPLGSKVAGTKAPGPYSKGDCTWAWQITGDPSFSHCFGDWARACSTRIKIVLDHGDLQDLARVLQDAIPTLQGSVRGFYRHLQQV